MREERKRRKKKLLPIILKRNSRISFSRSGAGGAEIKSPVLLLPFR
jgi:hypothetical protein